MATQKRPRPRFLREQLPVQPGQMNPQADGMRVPRHLGPAPYLPSQPEGPNNVERRIILPGSTFPPPDAVPVDVIGEADIANGASANILAVQIPDGFTFRIAGIGFGAIDASALAFVSWTVRATPPGIGITPYLNQPAGIGSIQQLSEVFVVRGSSELIQLVLANTAAVPITYHYVGRMRGWFYRELEVR